MTNQQQSERPTCATCPYWIETPIGDADSAGKCVAHPPVISDASVAFLALYQSGRDGELYHSPLKSPDEAGRVWETLNAQVDDYVCWKQPTTQGRDTCGEHPDFRAWLTATRQPQ